MSILTSFRRRLADTPSAPAPGAAAETADQPEATTALPFDGYGSLNEKQLINSLSHHSQVELEAIDGYERANKGRIAVLDKLRYMRGQEPMDGYDALSSTQVVEALETADMVTIKRVRAYERKFANRPDVTEQVIRVHERTLAGNPAPPPAGYQAPKISAEDAAASASAR
jgi:hypothetical protein